MWSTVWWSRRTARLGIFSNLQKIAQTLTGKYQGLASVGVGVVQFGTFESRINLVTNGGAHMANILCKDCANFQSTNAQASPVTPQNPNSNSNAQNKIIISCASANLFEPDLVMGGVIRSRSISEDNPRLVRKDSRLCGVSALWFVPKPVGP